MDKTLNFIAQHILGRLVYRIAIGIIIIVVITIMTLQKISDEPSTRYFQNIWIFAGFIITLLITGFSLLHITYNSFDKLVPALKPVIAFCGLGFLALIVLVAFGLGSGMLQNWPTFVFNLLAIAISIYIFVMDYLLKKSGYFPLVTDSWNFVFEFDIGIIIAVVLVVIFGHIIEGFHGKFVAAGFIGGATAFQLLIANVLFNPIYYEIKEEGNKQAIIKENNK
ncbi:MAG: hypothetical protein HY755_04640 [Nitrospirae bacterium]|nr:hypothetical protein [Nitrospirota bacterium]